MKTIGMILLAAGIVFSPNRLHAQTALVGSFNNDLAPAQPAQPDSIVQVTAEAEGLSQVDPSSLPFFASCWWTVFPDGGPVPMPCPPQDLSVPIYEIVDGSYLVDETGGAVSVSTPRISAMHAATTASVASAVERQGNAIADLIEQVQETTFEQTLTMAFGMDAPSLPAFGDSGTNTYTPQGGSFTIPNYGTNLWIAQVNITNGYLDGIGTNTLANVQYEIQSRTNLAQTDWQSEGFIVGSEITNWTPLSVAQGNRTNLFIRLQSGQSSDGSGLPDWWELEYFGYTGVDPYADPMGDGYSNLQKFQNGWNPHIFYTPTAPQGVTASLHLANDNATVSWLPSLGTVTGYTLEKTDGNLGTVQDFNISANTTSYLDALSNDLFDGNNYDVSYQVMANYANGNRSSWSTSVALQQQTLSALIIPGTNGTSYLAISGSTANASIIRLVFTDGFAMQNGDTSFNYTKDVPVSSFTNGLAMLPSGWEPPLTDSYGYAGYNVGAETVDASGNPGGISLVSPYDEAYYDIYGNYLGGDGNSAPEWGHTFYDGRVQLKQNLTFLLRAATISQAFSLLPTNFDSAFSLQTNYAYSSFNMVGSSYRNGIDDESVENVLAPFELNYFFRNFTYDASALNTFGYVTNGFSYSYNDWYLLNPPAYQFQAPLGGATNFSALLGTNQTRWLAAGSYIISQSGADIGIPNTFSMSSNVKNIFGLPFLSAQIAQASSTNLLSLNYLSAGSSFVPDANDFSWVYYPETAQPIYETVEYDFWAPFNAQKSWDTFSESWSLRVFLTPNKDNSVSFPDLIPGMDGFSPTNKSRIMIMPVGREIKIAGYAKLAIQNGCSNKFAYLGQYFDKAYTTDTNGIATTNTTGVLSPYGDFFATQPGPASLVTMPDVDTGQRGTNIVHCISLNVDKNHDGTIDLSFSGPDVTSQSSPMEFWINNDNDGTGVGQDIDAPNLPDSANDVIQSTRDLEDFARIWICGVPSGDVMDGYQVTLSFQNCVGSPSIKLFASHDDNGGNGYLTDSNIAERYVGSIMNDFSLGTVSVNTNYVFPYLNFYNGGTKCLLFEGVTAGAGELVMTITDSNSNTIAQTGVWLDLHDVKDFIEQAIITNNISGAVSNWTSGVESIQPATTFGLGNDTNLIVLVHGINVSPWDSLTDSETVYKRLYWAGFQGAFATVKWPCEFFNAWTALTLDTTVFNRSEVKAYKASSALTNYLGNLRSRFAGYRLNILAHSQGNAVVSEAIKRGFQFDSYVLTQGAIPDSAYDINAPTYNGLTNADYVYGPTPEWQPMGYRGVYTNISGTVVNFYNANDPVLSVWQNDQGAAKPNVPATPYTYFGGIAEYDPAFGSSYIVTDPEESRAFVSRSRTLAIGQSGPASRHGVIQSGVNLNTQFGFNDSFPGDHSAQWVWPIQTTILYYSTVLSVCNISTPQEQ